MKRKEFIKYSSILSSTFFFPACQFISNNENKKTISGKIIGAEFQSGHLLRNLIDKNATEVIEIETLIIGAGISGLTSAYYLHKANYNNFTILELAENPGGNSLSGKNEISAYPWGAHYLPIPDIANKDLISFLYENNIITHFNDEGLPFYDEAYLCHDPDERLFIKNHWQEGIIPHFGVPENDKKEIDRFLKLMAFYRKAKGNDGKFAFEIPLEKSSGDEDFWKLDKITFIDFLTKNNFKSPYLFWYVDYCCKDDYGTKAENTSAWAGIHYYASRRGKGANADYSEVLTWPEGNGFLINKLLKNTASKIHSSALTFNISKNNNKYEVDVLFTKQNMVKKYICKHLILATPQFINDKILKLNAKKQTSILEYAPWLTANITLNKFPSENGFPLSWDNVIYGSDSLGYVNACHQNLQLYHNKYVFTYYKPLTTLVPKEARKMAMGKSHSQWVDEIIKDLKVAHYDIEKYITNIDVNIWGHAMPQPKPEIISSNYLKDLRAQRFDNLYFVNSDISGISIFEEAFYNGKKAADFILEKTKG